MAFGNISSLYFPIAGTAGASLWGVDVRKLLSSPDGTADASTITSHGSGGTVARQVDPYSDNNIAPGPANWAWAITPADMNSVAGARRYIPAGNHVFTMRGKCSNALGKANQNGYTVLAYRVGPSPGFTRTLLGFGQSGPVSFPALGASSTFTAAIALPELVFEANETIHYSISLDATGSALGNEKYTFFTGTEGGISIRIDLPGGGLGTLYQKTGAVSGAGIATLGRRTIGKGVSVAGTGVVSIARQIRLAAKSVAGAGIVAIQKYVKPDTVAVTGIGVAGGFKALARQLGTTAAGIAAVTKMVQTGKTVTAAGVAGVSKFVTAFRQFSVTAVGQAGFARALIAVRAFKVVGAGIAALYVKIKQTILNRLEGGAQIIRRTVINLFGED